MTDTSEDPRVTPDDCEGPKLKTLRAVRKEMACVYRLLKREHIEPGQAHVMLTALAMMLKADQDTRDTKWVAVLKQMQKEQQATRPSADAH